MVYKEYFASLTGPRPSQSKDAHMALLLVSKTVNIEATPAYYRESCFITSSLLWPIFSPSEDFPLPTLPFPFQVQRGSNFQRDFSEATKSELQEDVSKIYTRYLKDLPKWLFGAPYVRNFATHRSVRSTSIPGYSFARFLRQIGSHNASRIKSLSINCRRREFFHLLRACYELPLYATIIRQHLPNVENLVLGTLELPCLIFSHT